MIKAKYRKFMQLLGRRAVYIVPHSSSLWLLSCLYGEGAWRGGSFKARVKQDPRFKVELRKHTSRGHTVLQ